MFNLQGSEIIVILLLALVVLGPEKLPDAIRKFSQTYNELKKMGTGFQSEIKSALDEPMREMRATADLLKDSVDPDKLQQEATAEAELQRQAEAEADRMVAVDEAAAVAAADRARDATAAERSTHSPNGVDGARDIETNSDSDNNDDVPSPPINQIAQANARGPIDTAVATPTDVDTSAIPTFATADEDDANADDADPDDVMTDAGNVDDGTADHATADEVNTEAVSPEDAVADGFDVDMANENDAIHNGDDLSPPSGDDVNEAAVS